MTSVGDISGLIDLSAVRADSDASEVRALVDLARITHPAAVFTLPAFSSWTCDLLSDLRSVLVGGVVGFPSGGHTPATKAAEAAELVRLGCRELDMVINIGWLRSGRYQDVAEDIQAVVQAAQGNPVKVILECHYLSPKQIGIGCRLCVDAGASFVKTGTGWAPTGATIANVQLIRESVGDAIGIKAAGGIDSLETLLALRRAGASRFGIGIRSAYRIFGECVDFAAHRGEGTPPASGRS